MRPVARTNRLRGVAAVVCCAAVLPAVAPSPAASTARSSTPPCPAAATRAWLGLGLGGGTAGTYYYPLELSNVGSRACTLYGYPGVSLAGGHPVAQVGPAASENPTPPRKLVTLAPGQVANALLRIVDALNYPPSKCGPVATQWLQIYPPNETTPVYLAYKTTACSKQVKILSVSVVQPGSGGSA